MHPARRTVPCLALVLWAAGVLAGCGDGSTVSWCFGSPGVAAGYNTTDCPPTKPESSASAS